MNVKKEIKTLHLVPSKKMGQNFLFDENIAKKIVSSIKCDKNNPIVEIGPGLGILTQYLTITYDNLFLIEKDTILSDYLKIKYPNVSICNGDFLKYDFSCFNNFCIISNLPYSISKFAIRKITDLYPTVSKSVLMLQKEVVRRLTAKPKSKEYGAITVITSLFYEIRILFNVSKSVFYPIPKVDSSVILLQRKGQLNLSSDDYKPFVKFIYSCFNSRRKKLKNNIDFNICNDLYFKELIDKRAEELNLVEFIKLFLLFKSK